MSVTIGSSTYCLCGAHMSVQESSFKAIEDFHALFAGLHSGEGHELFPTAAEAKRARRKAVSS